MINFLDRLEEFRPLFGVFGFVIVSTLLVSFLLEASLMVMGQLFMASFFLTFGGFKVYNLEGFRKAFKMYDPLAQRNRFYADFYPFIELALGVSYLLVVFLALPMVEMVLYSLTVLVVAVNAAGVFKALNNDREIQCACLGDVFNVPMTRVTLIEDLVMIIMAV